ncbi:MAG: T9SS type A sorting domain-containing protein [Candidatus Latescibacteria bacterium]|nr:T9SS type A sorting domain-containing protein [Candidatus Latescibacterota bacterium]
MRRVFLFVFVVMMTVCSIPLEIIAELEGGRWIHHERQTPQYDITGIFPSEKNKIWVSTDKTFHEFDGMYWKKIVYDDQSLRDHTPFYCDDDGRFYFVEGGALLVLENGVITSYKDEKLYYPIIADKGDQGILYMGLYDILSGGIYSFDGQKVSKIHEGRARSVAVDNTGKLWVTLRDPESGNMSLLSMKNDTWTTHDDEIASIFAKDDYELTVQIAPDGAVWVNNLGKYGVLKNGEWIFGNGGTGPMYLTFDSTGTIWGYRNKKLYMLNTSGIWEISKNMDVGLLNRQNFLTEDKDGTVWTFDSYHVYSHADTGWVEVKNNLDLASDTVTCMLYNNGYLYCGHGLRNVEVADRKNHGISVWDGITWKNYNKADDNYLYNIYILKKSPDDEIVAHTDHGLKIFNGKAWAAIDTLKALDVSDFIWDENGVMWVASYYGLLEYKYPNVDFIVHPQEIYDRKIFYNMNYDPEGILYMQTNYGSIVSYYEDREDVWMSHESNSIYSTDIAIDDAGTIWCSRQNFLSEWDIYKGWVDRAELNYGRMVEIDETGRIWASGLGTTGYLEDDEWHLIPELAQTASDKLAFDGVGRYTLNAFNLDTDSDPVERKQFTGIYEYVPDTVNIESSTKPEPFITAMNYPNPFNPSTTINFTLPSEDYVTVAVYNVNGQKVSTLLSEKMQAGNNNVTWDSLTDSGVRSASGIYFYRIEAGNYIKSGKMLLIR